MGKANGKGCLHPCDQEERAGCKKKCVKGPRASWYCKLGECRKNYMPAPGKKCVFTNGKHPCDLRGEGKVCQHKCIKKGKSFKCACNKGFKLADLGRCKRKKPSQKPKNPCKKKNGGCAHICKNVDGEAVCSCRMGFELKPNRKSCLHPCDREEKAGCKKACKKAGKKGNKWYCVGGCQKGYMPAPGKRCAHTGGKHPCDLKGDGKVCQHKCNKKGDSFICSCNAGYTLTTLGRCEKPKPVIEPSPTPVIEPPPPPPSPTPVIEPPQPNACPQVQQCIGNEKWTKLEYTKAPKAKGYAEAGESLEKCKEICLRPDVCCNAIDWNIAAVAHRNIRCWLHFNDYDWLKANLKTKRKNVHQYRPGC